MDTGYAIQERAMSAPREATIFAELNEADEGLKKLHGLIDELENRIAPVLGPMHDSPPDKLNQVRPESSDIRARLMDHNAVLRATWDRLRTTLDRIEI